MSRRRARALVPCAAIVVLAIAALVIAGLQPVAVRTFALDAPSFLQIAQLRPAARVCEGPVTSGAPARSVGIWGAASSAPARVLVEVQDATSHRVLASGALQAGLEQQEHIAHLSRSVSGGRELRVCLVDVSNGFSVWGSATVAPGVTMTGAGRPGAQFSLLLLSDRDRSVLGSLCTAFARASLWHLAWVRSWTFWILAIAVLATFGLVIVAVADAAASEPEES